MLDSEFHISSDATACLVSIVCPNFEYHKTADDTERSLGELRELMRTLEIDSLDEFVQNRKNIDPATILGSGKIEEIAQEAKDLGASLLVFDFELTASQIRNIKKISGISVVDRCHIILEIFARHSRTKEAKIQIEISRLNYILPRLSGFWSHLGRQKGGIGVRGGEGEQQIELDRRIIRSRIEYYKKELKEVEKARKERKKNRGNYAVTAALVGYTNAGKSSLMNRLCRVDILEQDKLFATLDSTYRTLNPDSKPKMILIDTVGFISNLPSFLIEGFKTTLESALEADLLINVCDLSDPNFKKHLEVTNEVLKELKVGDKPQIIVFNKKDKITDPYLVPLTKRLYPGSFVISSFDKSDVNSLREHIINFLLDQQDHYDLFVPYDQGEAHSIILGKTNVIKSISHEKGVFYRIRIPDFIFNQLGIKPYILRPDDPLLEDLE
ncbi:MAG: GTPase HflX [Bacteriovoracaceae bacterium]